MDDFKIPGIKNKTLKDTIYSTLKDIILNNNFPSSDYISEQSLANQLNVSRTPLREAMYDLINEDLIEFKPRKGYRLKPHSADEVSQIFLLRSIIEKGIAVPLLENVTDTDIIYFHELVSKQDDAMKNNDGFTFMNLDKEFHRKMFKIAQYNIFLKSYDVFHNLTILIGSKAITKQGRMIDVIKEHSNIVKMIEAHDLNALEKSISEHLKLTHQALNDINKSAK